MIDRMMARVPAHLAGSTNWHGGDLLSAVLIVIAIVGVALAVSGHRHRLLEGTE